MDALEGLGFVDGTVDAIAELFGLQDTVTLGELRSSIDSGTLPGRDFVQLRRALDPKVRAVH